MADDKATAAKENLQLASPPKPTRMIKIQPPTTQTSLAIKNQASTLPALAGEVALAQKNQMQELEKRLNVLKQVKEKYHEVLRAKASAERDVQAVTRKSNMLQDDIEVHQINCGKIQKEIEGLICETTTLKRHIGASEAEFALKKSDNEKYMERMKSYAKLVEVAENMSDVNISIEKENKEIEELTKEKADLYEGTEIEKLLSGEIREIALAEIVTLEETRNDLQESLRTNVKIEEEEAKQAKLRREIELLQKKYQAQLTWTRKQLQETMARNKQWNEEAAQKEREIREIREKIRR